MAKDIDSWIPLFELQDHVHQSFLVLPHRANTPIHPVVRITTNLNNLISHK